MAARTPKSQTTPKSEEPPEVARPTRELVIAKLWEMATAGGTVGVSAAKLLLEELEKSPRDTSKRLTVEDYEAIKRETLGI